jgi:hypothetical protein
MIGIRMPEVVITDLKSEARRRKMSVGKLVQELWAEYRERAAKPKQ